MSFQPMIRFVIENGFSLKTSELIFFRETLITKCNIWKALHSEAKDANIFIDDNYQHVYVDGLDENLKRSLYGFLMEGDKNFFDDVSMHLEQVD